MQVDGLSVETLRVWEAGRKLETAAKELKKRCSTQVQAGRWKSLEDNKSLSRNLPPTPTLSPSFGDAVLYLMFCQAVQARCGALGQNWVLCFWPHTPGHTTLNPFHEGYS